MFRIRLNRNLIDVLSRFPHRVVQTFIRISCLNSLNALLDLIELISWYAVPSYTNFLTQLAESSSRFMIGLILTFCLITNILCRRYYAG